MGKVKLISFKNAKSDFELLDKIRMRYQMYAHDLSSLVGILTGYSMASNEFEDDMGGFSSYFSKLKNYNSRALHWSEYIKREAELPEYEIPIFFKYLDEYREIVYEVLGTVELTSEQRYAFFQVRIKNINMDYPELPLKPPHRLECVSLEDGRVRVFYFNHGNEKYYEQTLGDFDYCKQWAKSLFNIDGSSW